MIQTRCDRCTELIGLGVIHVVRPGLGTYDLGSHWHLGCWDVLVFENKRKAEQSGTS